MLAQGVKNRFVQDNLNGRVELEAHEMQVLRTPTFTRLNRIQQLGLGSLVFPTATHTRAAHSIGVLAMVERVSRALNLPDEERLILRLAGLLHDIGQYPLSHCIEQVYQLIGDPSQRQQMLPEAPEPKRLLHRVSLKWQRRYGQASDKALGAYVIENDPELSAVIASGLDQDTPRRVAGIVRNAAGDSTLFSQVLDSPYDCDRLDYVRRDSLNAGIHYGSIDLDQLFSSMLPHKSGGRVTELTFESHKGMVALEQYLLARYNIYAQLTFHKTIRSLELMAKALFLGVATRLDGRVFEDITAVKQAVGTPEFHLFDDSCFWGALRAGVDCGDPEIETLARRLMQRKPLKMAYEWRALCKAGNDPHLQRLLPASRNMDKLSKLAELAGVSPKVIVVDAPDAVELTPGLGVVGQDLGAEVKLPRSSAPLLTHRDGTVSALQTNPGSLLGQLLGMSLYIVRVYVLDDTAIGQVRDACHRVAYGEAEL